MTGHADIRVDVAKSHVERVCGAVAVEKVKLGLVRSKGQGKNLAANFNFSLPSTLE